VFIARKRSYHGATLGALGVSGHTARRFHFESVLPKGTRFVSPCYPYRDLKGKSEAQYIEELKNELDAEIRAIGPENVAGFFAEPVVGAVSFLSSGLRLRSLPCTVFGLCEHFTNWLCRHSVAFQHCLAT
jgi:adenosylmethionine-8-amino-7-oxononanoate aminotransferase